MAKRLGVMIIHGMGSPESSFAEGLTRRLNERLGKVAADVEFESCYWAPILQKQQDVTWQKLLRSGRLNSKALRKWVVAALGDPASYLSGYFRGGMPVYTAVHECVRSSLRILAARLQNANRKPLMVLAHSLGTVIMSNYIWDEQKGQGMGTTAYERTETLTSFVTYGSNIPLFLPPSPPITCIRFPGQLLPAHLQPVAKWVNVYDPDDVLGYPLAEIWDETQGTLIHDTAVNAGIWPMSETPFSHTLYDRDDDFLDIVLDQIRTILAAN